MQLLFVKTLSYQMTKSAFRQLIPDLPTTKKQSEHQHYKETHHESSQHRREKTVESPAFRAIRKHLTDTSAIFELLASPNTRNTRVKLMYFNSRNFGFDAAMVLAWNTSAKRSGSKYYPAGCVCYIHVLLYCYLCQLCFYYVSCLD